MTKEAFTIEGQPCQVIGFKRLIHVISPIMSLIPLHFRGIIYKGNSLSSLMIEQTIIQVTLASIEMFNETKSKFGAWMESIKKQCKYKAKMQYT